MKCAITVALAAAAFFGSLAIIQGIQDADDMSSHVSHANLKSLQSKYPNMVR